MVSMGSTLPDSSTSENVQKHLESLLGKLSAVLFLSLEFWTLPDRRAAGSGLPRSYGAVQPSSGSLDR